MTRSGRVAAWVAAWVLGGAAAGGAGPREAAGEFPEFRVPGQEEEMGRLRDLFLLHRNPKSHGTFHLPYLVPSVLWPATGPEESAAAMREFYRVELLSRKIDEEGYVTCNQHRGHAHNDGWPFPLWAQSGGRGWHFTHAGDPFAGSFRIPLSTSLAGWETGVVTVAGHDPGAGLLLELGPGAVLTAPPMDVDALVAPYIAFEWNGMPGEGARPFLEWTTDAAPEFDTARRIAFDPMPAPPTYDRRVTMIPAHRHPEWKGRITRLRLNFGNAGPGRIVLRALHTAVDSRHSVNNPFFVEACADYFDWTADAGFLWANIGRIRRATDFAVREFGLAENGVAVVPWVGHDGRAGFSVGADGKKQILAGRGVGNNYWDLLPFGGQDALLTMTMHRALLRAAGLEEAIARHPEWNIPAVPERAGELRALAARLRDQGTQKFWNAKDGRFYGWIDREGEARDYGFTFLNLEAVHYGFAREEQSRAIVDWVSGKREVAGDTSRGADIYHWRFGPRATTRRNIECYGWVWHNPESIPWGYQVQDGGAVLGFSFYDLMARLRVNGPDDAWERLKQITAWFAEVQQEGGYRKYYAADPARGTLQGGGPPGGLGMDHEFMESVLLPQVMLYGFLGFTPQPEGFRIEPRLPQDWPSLTITRIAVQDHVLDITASPDALEIKCRRSGAKPLRIAPPPGPWQTTILGKDGQSGGAPLAGGDDGSIALALGEEECAKLTRQTPTGGGFIKLLKGVFRRNWK